jgi:hypothetical protein
MQKINKKNCINAIGLFVLQQRLGAIILQLNRGITEFTDTQRFIGPGELVPDFGVHSHIPGVESRLQHIRGFQFPDAVGFAAVWALDIV